MIYKCDMKMILYHLCYTKAIQGIHRLNNYDQRWHLLDMFECWDTSDTSDGMERQETCWQCKQQKAPLTTATNMYTKSGSRMENIRRAISAALCFFFKSNLLWTEMEPLSTTLSPNSAPSGNERHQGTQHFAVLVCDIERPIQGETLEVSMSITYMDDGTCITIY